MDFRSFAEQSLDALVLVQAGRVVHLNAAALHRLGGTASAWEGRPVAALPWPAARTEQWPVSRDLECLRLLPRAGGSFDDTGTICDVAQARARELRLEQLSATVQQASDMIAIIDVETMEYVDVNEARARVYGISREELLARGSSWAWPRAGLDRETIRRAYQELVRRSPEVITQEIPIDVPGAPHMDIEFARRAVRVGNRWLVISIGHDITARKRTEAAMARQMAELARSNQELERFAYVASHDLLEPLRMVASYTQLLQRRYRDQLPGDGQEFMDYIVAGARRMKQLLEDLLSYSRVGRVGAPLQDVAIDSVLDEALDNLRPSIDEAGAVIERGPLPVVSCSRAEMVQLLQNLIGNALKFQAPGRKPVVRVDASEGAVAWTFNVADNGIGIPSEHFDRIFVIFQRLHRREDYDGTGVGLAICKKILDRHGGRIWVESDPGVGSTFHFTLPRVPPSGFA